MGMRLLGFCLCLLLVFGGTQVADACSAGQYISGFSCINCDPGWYGSGGGYTCWKCVPGKYSGGAGFAECSNCDHGKYSDINGAGSCTSCAAGKASDGQGMTSADTCRNCNPGQYSTGGTRFCTSCDAGKYSGVSAATDSSTCNACPTNSYSSYANADVGNCYCNAGSSGPNGGPCNNCAAGKYKTAAGTAGCTDCVAGKYSTTVGAASDTCGGCPTNSYSTIGSGAVQSCICNVGTTGPNGGPCNNCDAGKYKTSTGAGACTSCDAGKYSTTVGAASNTCTGCPSNTYSPEGSRTLASCVCNTGTYAQQNGVACTSCVAGKYKTSTGAGDCTSCTAGKYSTVSAATTASTCDPTCVVGTYSLAAATVCLNCHNGLYQDETGKGECKTCLPGEFTRNDDTPKSACTHCLAGYYQPYNGKTTCITCDPGKYQATTRQVVCTECAAGLFSPTTAATHGDFCVKCMAGTYSNISASSCTACIKGTYTPAAGLSTCTMCVGEQAYAPNTGMTTCFQCIDKRQISDIFKTYCFVCKDGEYEDRPNSQCLKCPIGKYSDGTTNRKCMPCRSGTYAASVGTAVCTKCNACPDSFYRVNCTVTDGGGYCLECEKCADPKTDVRVDCMNRAGHNNASGVCRLREFTVRNPYCDNQGSGYFLGGYPFNELFGTSQDNADFQCRGICDGVTNRLTDAMKTEANLVKYKEESFDSGYCKGPYACDVPTCVIYGVSDDSQPAFRTPAACPVIIEDAVTEQLWAVTTQVNYDQHPLTVAVQSMRYDVECQSCSTCGAMPTKVRRLWPLMQNYTDWGRGCARECTELSCELGEIFDWTVTDATQKCRQCSELEDVRLCTSEQQLGFADADVSGNLPKLTFKDCQPKRIIQYGIARASYGDCVRCPEVIDACSSKTGQYYATCDVDLKPVCKNCDTRATALSSYFNGSLSVPLYCQKTLCLDDKTGVTVDVFPHRTCHRQCSKTRCASDRIELPCLLPHDKRCKSSISFTDFPADEMHRKQGYVPAHANVLERVSGLHMFSSFENVLLSVDSIPLQRRRVCVWNADGIADNDMNPAGVAVQFEEACRPWTRDPGTRYPLLPLQNTVTDTTEFQRRILLNTSAIAMHYLSQWHNVQRIPSVFTGDVFLDLDLTNTSHTALVAFVSPDRLLSNITSVVRWHVSVYAQQTVGFRDDVLIGIETPDDVEHCDECFSLEVACMPPDCTPLACPAGTYSSVVDAMAVCPQCPAGKYSATAGSSACTDCESGKYTTSSGESACSSCPAGTYSIDAMSCAQCPSGKYSATAGSSACTDCESGKYQSSSGTSVCSSCPANSTSPVSSTASMSCVCSAGFTGTAVCSILSSTSLQWSCGVSKTERCPIWASGSQNGGVASRAIDNNLNSHFSSEYNYDAWLSLDFQRPVTVTKVTVNQYSSNYWLQNYKIQVGPSSSVWDSSNALCASGLSGTREVSCPTPLIGQYLHISISGVRDHFNVAEVAVAGLDGVCPVLGCNACPAGTYKNSSGSSVCTNCTAGAYLNVVGATSCYTTTTSTPAPTSSSTSTAARTTTTTPTPTTTSTTTSTALTTSTTPAPVFVNGTNVSVNASNATSFVFVETTASFRTSTTTTPAPTSSTTTTPEPTSSSTTSAAFTTSSTPAPTTTSTTTSAARTTTTTPAPTPSSMRTTNTSLSCSTAPHSAFRTAPVAVAWQDFCGDKFHLSVKNGSVYACDESMQRRVQRDYTTSHTALAVLAGALDAACPQESLFSVQMTTSDLLLGGTESLAGKCCLGFVFSQTSVFCLSVEGLMHTVSDARLHADAFSIQSLVVYNDSLFTTISNNINEITTTYVSNISSMCASLSGSVTARVLNVPGTALTNVRFPIFMLATGNPLYFLSIVDAQTQSSVMLRKHSCSDLRMMTSTFCESVNLPVQLFSGNLPSLETQNTLLHARGDGLLFVTSTETPLAVTVMMLVFVSSQNITRKSVALTTEARDIVYPNNGQAHRISGAWISDSAYIVALEDQQQIWRLTLGTGIALTLLPSGDSMFPYRFVSLGGAVLTKTVTGYSLTTCMAGCSATTTDKDVYYAFGNDTLTYKRLLPCRDSDVSHVNALDLRGTPAETCSVAEYNRSDYWMQYALSFKCKQSIGVISMSVTLQVGAVVRITANDTSLLVTSEASQLLSMYAQCVNRSMQYIDVFDDFSCLDGCRLLQVSQVLITGKVRINYVLHSDVRPSNGMIYTQVHSSTYSLPQPELATSFDSWTQHSAFTHTMLDLQRIQVNLRRPTAAFALSERTHVALDVLQVVPLLNLQAVRRVLPTNETVLLSLLHIPSDDDLAQLALIDSTVRGSDVSGWRRLHATAFVRSTGNALLDCVYDLRLVALDERFALRQASSKIGCRVRLKTEGVKAVGRCHLEVPFAMSNSAGVVGLLVQGTCELPPPDSVAVELNPFTSMSECRENQYLDADSATCAPCEMKDVVCGPGFYASGCEAMLWQSSLVACLPCPLPTHASFTNASVTCNDWTCDAAFFRADAACLNCTTSLRTVCARSKGQMWAACTSLQNEQCISCPLALLPRNAEWTNASECAWKCQKAYFNNNGICESCLSLKILKSVLSMQGTRSAGAFYKFRPCTETRQAEFSTCEFQQRLNATYTGDAVEFLNDCPVRCAEYLHQANTTVVDQNTTWKAAQCIRCPLESEPTYVDGLLVPRSAYDMDTSCSATCRAASQHYPVQGARSRCAFCPAGWCGTGQYATTDDGCILCRNCTSNLQGAFVFEREGLVDNNASCQETCAPGHYLADDGVRCLTHSDVKCAEGQFKVNGTARTDARCDECTDCSGYRQVRACSLTQDAKCESCGPLVWWSSYWNGTECQLACRSGYTKLYSPKPRCQRCSTCTLGFQRAPRPANCSDCTACAPAKPAHSEYISQCAWKCEKYHILHLDDETGMPQCIYSVAWSTNVPVLPPRRQYNISCSKGQLLTDELLCQDCPTPRGLNDTQVNVAWRWTDVGCAWQCAPGLLHFDNGTANYTQNLCLTRAQYKALVVRARTPGAVAPKASGYHFFLIVVLPLTLVLVCCGVLPRSARLARQHVL